MSLTPRLDLRPSQTLKMTVRLQHAISLLQMSALEIDAAVAQEIENNPFLERETDREIPADNGNETDSFPDGQTTDGEDFPDVGEEFSDDCFYEKAEQDPNLDERDFSMNEWEGHGAKGEAEEGFQSVDLCVAPPLPLQETLTHQINMTFKVPAERALATELMERLDENGYLTDVDPALLKRAEKILPILKTFSPTGIFAENLSDCLAIQLREKDRLDPAMQIMLDHLELIGAREYKKLSKLCGVDDADIADMIAEIRRLNPKPAAGFDAAPPSVLIPDVLLRRDKNGNFIVELNQAVLPRVLINRTYAAEISMAAKTDKAAKKFLTHNLSSANFLIKALNQRAETILKVATAIVNRQREFFKTGAKALKPMILKDIAEETGLHESTISRVTAHKYIAAQEGVFELKSFFSQALESKNGGEGMSSQSVKQQIGELIAAETPENVLSDEDLVGLLKARGIEIARRTVAKYRESLGIPTSGQRKRDKRLKA